MISAETKVALTSCIIFFALGIALGISPFYYEMRSGTDSEAIITETWGIGLTIVTSIIMVWISFLEWKNKKR